MGANRWPMVRPKAAQAGPWPRRSGRRALRRSACPADPTTGTWRLGSVGCSCDAGGGADPRSRGQRQPRHPGVERAARTLRPARPEPVSDAPSQSVPASDALAVWRQQQNRNQPRGKPGFCIRQSRTSAGSLIPLSQTGNRGGQPFKIAGPPLVSGEGAWAILPGLRGTGPDDPAAAKVPPAVRMGVNVWQIRVARIACRDRDAISRAPRVVAAVADVGGAGVDSRLRVRMNDPAQAIDPARRSIIAISRRQTGRRQTGRRGMQRPHRPQS
jgi:hypothetical protein